MNVNPFSVIAQKEKVYNASSANLSTLLPEGVSAILISSGTSITDYYTSQTVTLSGNMRGYAVRNGNNIVGWVANYDLTSEYYIGCNLSIHTTWDCIQKNALTSDIPTQNKIASYVSLSSTSSSNKYTVPSDGYIYVDVTERNTGYITILGSNEGNTLNVGGSKGYYATFVRSGMKAYKNGNVNSYFMPLS